MENDIKNIWKKEQGNVALEENQIDNLLKQESSSLINRIIKTIKTEHILNIVALPIFLIIFIYNKMLIEAVACLLIFVPFIVYYQKLIKVLKIDAISLSTHDYLVNSYDKLKRFIRHYKIVGSSITIVGFLFGIRYGTGWEETYHEIITTIGYKFWVKIIVLIVGLVFSIFLFHKIIQILYGKKMKALKLLIDDLEAHS